MLLNVEPARNTLPWDVAFGLFVLGFVGALVVLGLIGAGLL